MSKYEDDEKLIDEIRSSDRAVLRSVYLHYRDLFTQFLVRMFRCETYDAQEVYPEAFSKFYYNVVEDKLTPPLKSALKTYLFAIGKHTFQKRFRDKHHKNLTYSNEFPELESASSVLDMYEYEEQMALVETIMERLDENCRKTINLIFLKEYNTASAMEELGLKSLGAVRKRKFDCLRKMRKLVEEDPDLKKIAHDG